MPLVKRTVEPYFASRCRVSEKAENELQCIVSHTLANVIRQLSSLSKHAENLFAEIFNEANSYLDRTTALEKKVKKLADDVTELDPVAEEVNLYDISLYKHFKSANVTEQQVLSRDSLPVALAEVYGQCQKPPNLSAFNKYREDGKDGLKFYTDPGYFFDLWKEGENKRAEDRKKKRKQKVRQRSDNAAPGPTKVVAVQTRKVHSGKGQEFEDSSFPGGPPAGLPPALAGALPSGAPPALPSGAPPPPPSGAPPPPPSGVPPGPPMGAPPPPPASSAMPSPSGPPGHMPPPLLVDGGPPIMPMDGMAPPPMMMPSPPGQPGGAMPPPPPMAAAPPPPPGAPPMPMMSAGPPPPPAAPAPPPPPGPPPPGMPPPPGPAPSILNSISQPRVLRKASDRPAPPPDPRGNLLSAIRDGKALRNTDNVEKVPAAASGGQDVAAILARRIAIEHSDSEDEGGEDWDEDDDDWD